MNADQVLYNSDGSPTKCKCGNEAIGCIIGKENDLAWCSKCDPNITSKHIGKSVYKKPKNNYIKPMRKIIKHILKDDCNIKLRVINDSDK